MKAAILGYGKSGKAAETLLKLEGYSDITVYDDGDNAFKNISEFTDTYDIVAVSPGVNLRKYPNAPKSFTSEIELAQKRKPAGARVVGITGTNGKSTVTALTAQVLTKAGIKSEACGNIGLTYGECVLGEPQDCYVVELSSFQTGMLHEFQADCAIVTNLAEDHMDRYRDMDDYADDKMNLVKYIKEGGRLIIEDEAYLVKKTSFYKGETVKIDPALKSFPVLDGTKLDFGRFYADISKFPLSGGHNIMNLSYALLAADALCKFNGDVSYLVADLKGLAHRCEYVDTINGVDWINDSKGTNLHSTLTALKGFEKGVNVILGGKDKNGDFSVLVDVLNEKASLVVAYGKAGEKIENTLKDTVKVPVIRVKDMVEAVDVCFKHAKAGEKVVLSPACASFDLYRGFEHRGEHFCELVKALKKG
ncbi:UDP-N-acetylmuramoyl-L-alanine--D-glutamate ligase [Seleniivibrio woodruffii]|uniref:UDP-N-acetylmuramoyl-L-alanine--D-glutamate ligase n=1 Tax=Seleniivibrio woodruffii TaxID=1078050 RepID=UPI0039E26EDE